MNEEQKTPEEKFDKLFTFEESAFRLETLPEYSVGDADPRYQAYLDGKPIRDMHSQEWCDAISEWAEEGKCVQRVRLINENRSAYFNFEVEAAYPHNVASGEEIFMLKEEAFEKKFSLSKTDVWVLDNTRFLQMEYSLEGEFLDCFYTDDIWNEIKETKERLIKESTEFTEYIKDRRRKKI